MRRHMASYLRSYLQRLMEETEGMRDEDVGSDGEENMSGEESGGGSDEDGGGNGGGSSGIAIGGRGGGGGSGIAMVGASERVNTREAQRERLRREELEAEIAFQKVLQQKKDLLQQHDISRAIRSHLGSLQYDQLQLKDQNVKANKNVFRLLHARERNDMHSNTRERGAKIARRYVPNACQSLLGGHGHQVFCGQFSENGSTFMSASQDQKIRLYHTDKIEYAMEHRRRVTPFLEIQARDVGWSVVDSHFSPDQSSIIYSSWSHYVHLATIDMDERSRHEPLDLEPPSMRFCPFSIRFSPDSHEILAGANDCALYVYDIEYKTRLLRIHDSHDNDVNTVTYVNQNPHIFLSGSDDGLVKVWDKRSFSTESNNPVGVLAGHTNGITHVSSKGDGIYFISNGKDQHMKLWDLRKMENRGEAVPRLFRDDIGWDYRFERYPLRDIRKLHPQDMSLMTYYGHRVMQTLIRCYFSPMETTGQSFVYTGSQDGSVYIYDLLTGEMVQKLTGHSETVRDVSWHPRAPLLLSSSWDASVRCWKWRSTTEAQRERMFDVDESEHGHDEDDEYEDEDVYGNDYEDLTSSPRRSLFRVLLGQNAIQFSADLFDDEGDELYMEDDDNIYLEVDDDEDADENL